MKKGFTLVELLAIITILSILLMLLVPTVLGIIEDSKQAAYETQTDNIIAAGKWYQNDNRDNIAALKAINGIYYITLAELNADGYIELPINNPLTDEDFDPAITAVKMERGTTKEITYEIVFSPLDTCFDFVPATGTITDYNFGTAGCPNDVLIPSVINGATVLHIDEYAFWTYAITSVIFPNTLTSIGYYAFYDTDIAELVIPNSVTSLGEGAFKGNYLLRSITIGTGLTSIPVEAFGYSYIINLTIPPNITTIEPYAFYLNRIKSLNLPAGLTTIGEYAFCNNKLTSLSIPSSVTTIDGGAFNNQLLSDAEGFIYARNGDGSINNSILMSYGGTKTSGVVIPSNVVTIGTSAFAEDMISSVTIPSSVTTIGDYAFWFNSLSSISIPTSVTTIGAGAFSSNNLTSLTIPSTITSIGSTAFRWNSLSSITMGQASTTIGDSMLATGTNYFRTAYQAGGTGTYVGSQSGTWAKS